MGSITENSFNEKKKKKKLLYINKRMISYEKEGEKSIILKRIRFASKNPLESLTTTNSYYYDFFQFTQICMAYRIKPKCSV